VGIGVCGWLLTAFSWLIVIVTLPFSLCVCFKVSSLFSNPFSISHMTIVAKGENWSRSYLCKTDIFFNFWLLSLAVALHVHYFVKVQTLKRNRKNWKMKKNNKDW
jgi:hypothetical protein